MFAASQYGGCPWAQKIYHYNKCLVGCSLRGASWASVFIVSRGSVKWVPTQHYCICVRCTVDDPEISGNSLMNLAKHLALHATSKKKKKKNPNMQQSSTLHNPPAHSLSPSLCPAWLVRSLMGLCRQTDNTNGTYIPSCLTPRFNHENAEWNEGTNCIIRAKLKSRLIEHLRHSLKNCVIRTFRGKIML